MKKILTLLALSTLSALAQQSVPGPDTGGTTSPVRRVINIPGGCNDGDMYYNMTLHQGYTCIWAAIAGPGIWAPTGGLVLASNSAFTGPTAQLVCHAQYNFSYDGGADALITPLNNCTIPANAVITNVAINSTTAVTSAGSATMSVGSTNSGSGAAAFLALTAKATYALGAFVQAIPVPQTASTWIKTTSAGSITVTPAVATLTAGVVEIYVFYYISST
jgi:hypothetical protein